MVLRERVRPATWATMAVALAGIAIMVFGGIRGGRLLGNLVAFGTPVSFAIMLVTLRRAGDRDMIPAICLAGVVGTVLGFSMADTLAISFHDLALCIFLGVVQYGGGFVLLTSGRAISLPPRSRSCHWWKRCSPRSGYGSASARFPPCLPWPEGVIVLAAVIVQAVSGMRPPAGSRA